MTNCSDNIKKIGTGFIIPGECTERLIAGIQSHLAMKLQHLTEEFRQNQQQYMESTSCCSIVFLAQVFSDHGSY
jgi:hypothetical protein